MISFIIPTLNEEKIIEKILQNLSQYHGEKEIIISDGRSTDKTIEIARKYTDRIVIHDGKTRQTIGGGRNAGAAIARGEYLVFLDADLFVNDPDVFFSKALRIFEHNINLVGLTGSIKVLPEMETLADRIVFWGVDVVHFTSNNIFRVGAASGEFQMVRAYAFREIHGFDEQLAVAEDQDFFKRLSKIGRTRFVRELRVHHTGRRAHKIGWIKLLASWWINAIYVLILKRSKSKEWKVIR
ncbi:MAG: glycosyltransferase [Candidatus Paceibacterota bacterium]|jgi:glycosyltransferase involved in cell wall biosynthesis